jgi:hypothetical protein
MGLLEITQYLTLVTPPRLASLFAPAVAFQFRDFLIRQGYNHVASLPEDVPRMPVNSVSMSVRSGGKIQGWGGGGRYLILTG